MKVSRYNYPAQFGNDIGALTNQIGQMLLKGHYVLSDEVTQFEHDFSEYNDTRYTIGVNSGTDALLLALMALGIGPGDEVITQANTFHATVAAICLAGAKPVLVDAVEDSFQIDQRQIGPAITRRTRAIIPVHLYGYPNSIESLLEDASTHRLDVIEDAAQAHGAMVCNQRVGALGRVGCFSFHPSKNLAAAGDAGAIVTDDEEVASRIRELRSLGQASQNHHQRIGLNSKLDAIQAVVLRSKLSQLDAWNSRRRQVAEWYRERLSELQVTCQAGEHISDSVFHLFQIRVQRRDELLSHLRDSGIDAVVRYPVPIHRQPAFALYEWSEGQFPVAELLARELLCLPIRPDMCLAEVGYIVDRIRSFFSTR